MKKYFLLLVLVLIPSIVSANSLCTSEKQVELKNAANLIKIDYEEREREIDNSVNPYYDYMTEEEKAESLIEYYFDINILNITEDLYVEIKNNLTDEVKIVNYTDTDNGAYTYSWYNLSSVTTFTFTIKSSSVTPCEDESFGIKYLTTPMFNQYYNTVECEKYSEEDICQKYVTISGLDSDIFNNEIEKLETGSNDSNEENNSDESEFNFLNFITENKEWFIIGGLVVAIGVVTVVIVQKKRSKI